MRSVRSGVRLVSADIYIWLGMMDKSLWTGPEPCENLKIGLGAVGALLERRGCHNWSEWEGDFQLPPEPEPGSDTDYVQMNVAGGSLLYKKVMSVVDCLEGEVLSACLELQRDFILTVSESPTAGFLPTLPAF